MVKLDVDTLSTVPDAPPAAGPDRALDPVLALGAGVAEVAEDDVAAQAESPSTALISTAPAIHPPFLFTMALQSVGLLIRECRPFM
jgi:hypothetical protein